MDESTEGLNRNWFEMIAERVSDALLLVGRDRRINRVNRNAEALFGYARADLLGQRLELLVPLRFREQDPDHGSLFWEPEACSMAAGRELFAVRQDGTEIPIEIRLSPIETPQGRFTLAAVIDLTERKRSDARFQLALEAAPSSMLTIDEARRITWVNRNAEVLFGYRRDEMTGQPFDRLVPQRLRAGYGEIVSSLLAGANIPPIGERRDLFGLRQDGAEIPIEIELSPIEAPGGRLMLASITDLTARRRAEEVEQQMSALVESADDAILTKSLEGTIRSWNPGAERLLGYRAQDIIGQSVMRLLPDDRQNEENLILSAIRRGQRVAHFETVRRKSDGTTVDVSLTISPIRDRLGSIVGASKIMRDITRRKRSEDELRRSNSELAKINAELDEFVYTASHDLRAPLTGIGAVAQWILTDDDSLCAQSRERLKLIQSRIERMKRLLNDIRDYARTGRYTETSGPVLTAAELVAEVLAAFHVPPGFSARVDPSLQDIRIERTPLEQVLHNLIGNAIKHHDRSTGSVAVSAVENGSMVRFAVIDDGPGVPEEYREDVFEMFKVLKPRDEVEGSGMGLALVRKVVGRMGGTCGLAAVEGGRGAHVWFDWPKSRRATGGGE